MVPPTPLHHLCSLAASTIVAFSPLPFPIIHLFSTCWMDTDSSLAVSPSLPSLGASLYRILCMRRASAATSHVTEESVEAERWEEVCSRLNTKATSGSRQVFSCQREGCLVNPGDHRRGWDPASGSLMKLPSWDLMFPTLEGHFPSLSEGA